MLLVDGARKRSRDAWNPARQGRQAAAERPGAEAAERPEALFKRRSEEFATNHPTYRCMPEIGPLYTLNIFKMLQTPAAIVQLSESGPYRQILTDGRELPTDPNPT